MECLFSDHHVELLSLSVILDRYPIDDVLRQLWLSRNLDLLTESARFVVTAAVDPLDIEWETIVFVFSRSLGQNFVHLVVCLLGDRIDHKYALPGSQLLQDIREEVVLFFIVDFYLELVLVEIAHEDRVKVVIRFQIVV